MTPPTETTRLRAALPAVLAVILLAFAWRWFAVRWAGFAGVVERPPILWRWLAASVALLMLHAASALTIWRQLLIAVGARLTWRQAADSFLPSLLARYVPGKIWANAARLALAARAGVALGTSTGAILWETLIALGTASVVAIVGLSQRSLAVEAPFPADDSFSTGDAPFQWAAFLFIGTLVAWGAVALLARSTHGAALLHRFGGTDPVRRPAALVPAVVTSGVGWLIYGAAHLCIALSLSPLNPLSYAVLAGAVALAWAGGYLAVVMPVGLGVRDALLIVLLAPMLDPERALLFVALSRLVQLAVDSAFTLGWLSARWLRPAPAPTAPRSA